MKICVVEDHPVNLAVLKGVLAGVKGWTVEGLTSADAAIARCAEIQFDLVISDHQMPGMTGTDMIAHLRAMPGYAEIPIVIITADHDRDVRIAAITAGATDFLTKPVDPKELRIRAQNLIELRRAQRALSDRAVHLAQEVESATRMIKEREEEVITRLARAIEYRDGDTGDHLMRVATIARMLAAEMGHGDEGLRNIFLAAQLHDTGKIGIPDAILFKPGKFTPQEMAVMRDHTTMGGEVLRGGNSDLIRMAHDVALCHHERWDGGGYPHGIKGAAIPMPARIVSVADVLDALCSPRPYKDAWDPEDALAELIRQSGKAFDPDCIDAMQRIWPDVLPFYRHLSPQSKREIA